MSETERKPRKKRPPEEDRLPDKIGKRYQFTREDLEKALDAKRKTGRWGGGAAKRANVSRQDAGEVAEILGAERSAELMIPATDDALHLYEPCLQALQDGLESQNWRERFECSKLLLAYFWGRPTQQVVSDKQVRVMFDSPALKHVKPNGDAD